jgi:hypothetical protein
MSILSIKVGLDSEIELQFSKINQLIGSNIEKKAFIIDSLAKHFSKHKYKEAEEHQLNNIRLNGEEVGRNYFSSKVINNINDVEKEISLCKTSLMSDYILNFINEFKVNKAIFQLQDCIQGVIDQLNDIMDLSTVNVEMELAEYGIEEIIKNHTNLSMVGHQENYLSDLTMFEKTMLFLELLQKVNLMSPKKMLIIFNHIDTYVEQENYMTFVNELRNLCSKNDFTVLTASSSEGFCVLDEELVQGVNVINNKIFNVTSIDLIQSYVMNHYPVYKEFTSQELCSILMPIIHKIGKTNSLLDIESQVVLRLLNSAENIANKGIKTPNQLEIKYIQQA